MTRESYHTTEERKEAVLRAVAHLGSAWELLENHGFLRADGHIVAIAADTIATAEQLLRFVLENNEVGS